MNLVHNIYVILGVVTQVSLLATGVELQAMAKHRLQESELLYKEGFWSGANYLAGYAIEFGLKAVVCKKLGVDVFESNNVKGNASGKLMQAFQIHDIPALVLLSGLHPEMEAKKLAEVDFEKAWSTVSNWTEQRRYEFSCRQATAATFIKRVKELLSWIETHW